MKKYAILLLVAAAIGCSSKETVVVYSPHGQEMLSDYQRRFEDLYPDVRVQWLDMGSKEVHTRITAEQARPACDVWWGGPHTFFQQAVKEGLLAPWEPKWAGAVAPSLQDSEMRWFATHLSPLVILYNDRALGADEVPQTWDELLDEKWRGRIVLRRPLESGTLRTFLCAMIARQPDEDAGIAWLKKLHAQTAAYPESPTLLFDHLKKNEDRISVWLMPDVIMQRDLNDYPFGYHLPQETPVIAEGIAIVNNAPHREWAEKFAAFVTTQDSLQHQAEQYGKLPARQDIPRDILPYEMAQQPVDAMEIDWEHFARNEEKWLRRWEQEVYNSP